MSPLSRYIILLTSVISNISCFSQTNVRDQGITVYSRTQFYDSAGNTTFLDTLKMWYKDSMAIQELHSIDHHTGANKATTITYKSLGYRFIDLRTNRYFIYGNMSDTASLVKADVLPATPLVPGWAFYADLLQIRGEPEILSDTVIGHIPYKRIKFAFKRNDPKKEFDIGYLRCDGRGVLFSIEKSFAAKNNCTMTKLYSYRVGNNRPYGSLEVEFIADSIPIEMTSIFNAWQRNARKP